MAKCPHAKNQENPLSWSWDKLATVGRTEPILEDPSSKAGSKKNIAQVSFLLTLNKYLASWSQLILTKFQTLLSADIFLFKFNNRKHLHNVWSMFKINNEDTRTTSMTYFTYCSDVLIVGFEQANANWALSKEETPTQIQQK